MERGGSEGELHSPFIVRLSNSNKATLLHFVEQYVTQHSEQKPLCVRQQRLVSLNLNITEAKADT